MPRKSLDSAIEHRITFGNYERALVTEIKTDIEKSVKIAAVGAVAVPVTLGVGLVGGMGLLGYGLYQGLTSFGFGKITKEVGEELSDIKSNAWCWWTNTNRKFWGLKPVDCTKEDPDIPPSRRDRERTDQEQLEYEIYREERKARRQQREDAQRAEMGDAAYEQMIADGSQYGGGSSRSRSDEEQRAYEARQDEKRAEQEAADAANRAAREERRRQRAAEAQDDDSGDIGSSYGGGSTASGNEPNNDGERDESGNAPSRNDGSNRGGRS